MVPALLNGLTENGKSWMVSPTLWQCWPHLESLVFEGFYVGWVVMITVVVMVMIMVIQPVVPSINTQIMRVVIITVMMTLSAKVLKIFTFLVTTSSQISSRLGWGEASASKGSLKDFG